MKRLLLIAVGVFLISFESLAQRDWRQFLCDGLGGQQVLRNLKTFGYSITRTGIDGGITSVANVSIDMLSGDVEELRIVNGDTMKFRLKDREGFEWIDNQWRQTTKAQIDRLKSSVYYNFVWMFLNSQVEFAFVKNDIYKGHNVHILRVKDLQGVQDELDLFVDSISGRVLTSSAFENGGYSVFFDEYDYEIVCQELIFPKRFVGYKGNEAFTQGVFWNFVCLK